jgi:hypothetical protein
VPQKKKKNKPKTRLAGGVAQMVEWLSSKYEAMNSKPSPSNKTTTKKKNAGHWWLMLVTRATQKAEISIEVRSQPGQIVCETLSRKNPSQKRADGVAQGVGCEFKPQYHKKQKCTEHQ